MNRTKTIDIAGKTYLLCYSTRAVRAVTDRFGSPVKMNEALNNNASPAERVEALLFVLHQLIIAGARFAKRENIDNPPPLTLDELHTLYPMIKPRTAYKTIKDAIIYGSAVAFDVKDKPQKGKSKTPKKTKMTPERYVYYGLQMGLDYDTALDIPHGELLSYINIDQVAKDIATEVYHNDEEEPFPDWE